MKPTAIIYHDMAHDRIIKKFKRDTYASLLKNEREAKERAARLRAKK